MEERESARNAASSAEGGGHSLRYSGRSILEELYEGEAAVAQVSEMEASGSSMQPASGSWVAGGALEHMTLSGAGAGGVWRPRRIPMDSQTMSRVSEATERSQVLGQFLKRQLALPLSDRNYWIDFWLDKEPPMRFPLWIAPWFDRRFCCRLNDPAGYGCRKKECTYDHRCFLCLGGHGLFQIREADGTYKCAEHQKLYEAATMHNITLENIAELAVLKQKEAAGIASSGAAGGSKPFAIVPDVTDHEQFPGLGGSAAAASTVAAAAGGRGKDPLETKDGRGAPSREEEEEEEGDLLPLFTHPFEDGSILRLRFVDKRCTDPETGEEWGLLAEGRNSCVYRAVIVFGEQRFPAAAKVIDYSRRDYKNEMRKLQNEYQAIRLLRGGVVQVYSWVRQRPLGDGRRQSILVMRKMDMTLREYVETKLASPQVDRETWRSVTAPYFACKLIECYQMCHRNNPRIFHRDVKPENVLVDTSDGQATNICLCDFGHSKIASRPLQGTVARTTVVSARGSAEVWCSPETSEKQADVSGTDHAYDPELVDIWGVGMLIYFLCTGRAPFETENEVCGTPEAIGNVLTRHEFAAQQPIAKDLVARLLAPNPKDRMSLNEALRHPFFWSPDQIMVAMTRVKVCLSDPTQAPALAARLDQNCMDALGCTDWDKCTRDLDPAVFPALFHTVDHVRQHQLRHRNWNVSLVSDFLKVLRNGYEHLGGPQRVHNFTTRLVRDLVVVFPRLLLNASVQAELRVRRPADTEMLQLELNAVTSEPE